MPSDLSIVDLLVANILASPLIMLSKEISNYVKPHCEIALWRRELQIHNENIAFFRGKVAIH